ncbi:hypothetical protein ACJ73_02178 [Blastomyces percursus]|uniref:GAF domain-containing protein n=1 Tax=Blastomyces percursus TaxID=1658174 RepID=A0A1J9RD12_9EURO|nr:hypothetical protein ACJ73_02178 [Blastomyces percursus]
MVSPDSDTKGTPSTKTLLLGPFQGKPACQLIQFGRGVCGTAAERRETVLVPDVLNWEGHIACDAESRSEIVVPILVNGETVAIIDIDCTQPSGFDNVDRQWLEALAEILADSCDWLTAFGCTIFGVLGNRYGLRKVLIFGTLGYAPYSAALYVNNRYGPEWFVLFGGVTCGLAASALGAAEGAIAMAYPTVKDRGKMTGIWLGLRELGHLIGASISLSLNVKGDEKGKAGYVTYLALISVQCLGLPLSFLISPPGKVIRPDGTKVMQPRAEKTLKGEFKGDWKVLKTKHMYMLIQMLVGFGCNVSYLGIYQTAYFSVRSRKLASLCFSMVSTIAISSGVGWFFDLKRFSQPVLAKCTWFFFLSKSKVTLDWVEPGFGRRFAVNVLFRFMNKSHYMFVSCIVGTFTNNLENITWTVAIIRSFESAGSAISYGIGAAKTTPMVNLIVSFVIFGLTVIPTSLVAFMVPENLSDEPLIAVHDGVKTDDTE